MAETVSGQLNENRSESSTPPAKQEPAYQDTDVPGAAIGIVAGTTAVNDDDDDDDDADDDDD
jgi:hypothetical protein